MENLKTKILRRVQESPQFVFLKKDFSDLGSYNQVGHALRQLLEERVVARISRGVYAQTRPSSLNSSKLVLAAPGGFKQVVRETLNRLGIRWRSGQAEEAYNRGFSTQIPVDAQVIIESRATRKISFGPFRLDCSRENSCKKHK